MLRGLPPQINRVALTANPPYKFWIVYGPATIVVHVAIHLLNRGAKVNLTSSTMVPNERKIRMNKKRLSTFLKATQQPFRLYGLIIINIRLSESSTEVWLEIAPNVTVDILLDKSFKDQLIRGSIPAKQKIVLWHSQLTATVSRTSKRAGVSTIEYSGEKAQKTLNNQSRNGKNDLST